MKKRILSLILAALLVSSALVSCANTEDDSQTDDTTAGDTTTAADVTTEPEEEKIDPRFVDELPEKMDYEGYTYSILTNLIAETAVAWSIIDIEAESTNGERINDAVYERNTKLQERFNISVKKDATKDAEGNVSLIRSLVQAGDEAFSVIALDTQHLGRLALEGVLANMSNLPYLNFDKGWWDTDAVYGCSIDKDHIYFAGGSSTLNTFRATWAVMFNKVLAENNDLPDLYQTVRDGEWTLDLLKECAQKISRDVNGNGEWDYGTDIYGLAYQYSCLLPMYLGAGARVVETKEDGTFNIVMDSARATEAMEKVYNFMNVDSAGLSLTDTHPESDRWVTARSYFMQGLFGFYMGPLSQTTLVTDSVDDFGILPMPKLDEKQEDYASAFQYDNYFCLAIPKNADVPERTALLTEAYTMLSYDTVREAWRDYTLTLRSARDEESGEMIDIILGARGCDIAFVYNATTNAQNIFLNAMKENSFMWASTVAAQKDAMALNVQKVIDTIYALED